LAVTCLYRQLDPTSMISILFGQILMLNLDSAK
jgi:hypothetical protein